MGRSVVYVKEYTRNAQLRYTHIVYCTYSGRNVNKPSAPIAVEGKWLNSDKQSDFTAQQNKLVNISS